MKNWQIQLGDANPVKAFLDPISALGSTVQVGDLREATELSSDRSRSALARLYKWAMESLLNSAQAAAYLGISIADFKSLRRRKDGPRFYRFPGGRLRYRKSWLDEWRDPLPTLIAELLAPEIRTGWVYFLQAEGGGNIKIGYASRVCNRIPDIRAASPVWLEFRGAFPGSMSEETVLHRFFAEHRLHGEWFLPVPRLLDLIARITPQFREACLA